MQTGTRAEFAAHRKVHKSTVTRWDKAKKLVWTVDRQIDFEKSAALIGETADPARHGVVLRHERERRDKAIESALFGSDETSEQIPLAALVNAPTDPGAAADSMRLPDAGDSADTTYKEFNRARANKEAELAKLAKMKREEQEGQLIRRDLVQRDIESLAAVVSKGLNGIPARVMPLLNAEPDPGKREHLLEREIAKVLSEFADRAIALGEVA